MFLICVYLCFTKLFSHIPENKMIQMPKRVKQGEIKNGRRVIGLFPAGRVKNLSVTHTYAEEDVSMSMEMLDSTEEGVQMAQVKFSLRQSPQRKDCSLDATIAFEIFPEHDDDDFPLQETINLTVEPETEGNMPATSEGNGVRDGQFVPHGYLKTVTVYTDKKLILNMDSAHYHQGENLVQYKTVKLMFTDRQNKCECLENISSNTSVYFNFYPYEGGTVSLNPNNPIHIIGCEDCSDHEIDLPNNTVACTGPSSKYWAESGYLSSYWEPPPSSPEPEETSMDEKKAVLKVEKETTTNKNAAENQPFSMKFRYDPTLSSVVALADAGLLNIHPSNS